MGVASVNGLTHVATHGACGLVWGAEGRGGIRLHGLDSCGGQDRGAFIVPVCKGRAGGTFGGIGDALGLVRFVRLRSTGEEGAAVEPVGLVFGWDAEAGEGGGDAEGGYLLVRDDCGFDGDSKLEGKEPLGKGGGGFDGVDNELLAGRGPVKLKDVVNVSILSGARRFVDGEVFGV